jgi:branched-subunit amino acid transport protein
MAVSRTPAFFLFLASAILLYGLAGSPTPDDPGLVEGAIAALLLLAVGVTGVKKAVDFSSRNFFIRTLQIFFLCGLIVPLLSAAWFGNDHGLILRDLAAFAFIGLPLFLSERCTQNERAQKILPYLLAVAGFLFAVRTLVPAFNIWIPDGELLYLSNSPLTLFAAIFMACLFWEHLKGFKPMAIVYGIAFAVIVAAMLLDVQRATIGAALLSLFLLAILDFIRTPKKVFLPLVILMITTFAFYPAFDDTIEAMASKTAQVGMNARIQEAEAVFASVRGDPLALFIGKGWGAVFNSPAVANLEVNYTHSFLTTIFLKGGLFLLSLAALFVAAGLRTVGAVFRENTGKGLALFWPFVVPVFLYASHKSLDFGLFLLLMGMWSVRAEALHPGDASVKT